MKAINKKYMDAHKELHMNIWERYIQEKRTWERDHPNATTDEHLKAMRVIQKKLGV